MTLYQIEAEHREIENALFEADGEITPELEIRMNITRENLEAKAIGYALVIKENNADLETIEAAIKDLKAKAQRIEKTVESLKGRILEGMQLFGVEKVQTALVKVWMGSSKRLSITDPDKVPDAFKTEVMETKIDARSLKSAIEGGLQTDGATITEHQNLQIR